MLKFTKTIRALSVDQNRCSCRFRCTFCGITLKHYVEANISKKSQTTLKYFLKLFASVSETVIFMFLGEYNTCHYGKLSDGYDICCILFSHPRILNTFVGLSTVSDIHHWDSAFVLLTLLFCLVYRCIGMFSMHSLYNAVGSALNPRVLRRHSVLFSRPGSVMFG